MFARELLGSRAVLFLRNNEDIQQHPAHSDDNKLAVTILRDYDKE